MRRVARHQLVVGLGVLALFFLFVPVTTHAADVSVSATVSGTTPPAETGPTVELHGFAAPNASLIVQRNGVQITTSTADSQGVFSIVLTDQPTGQQTYTVLATDTDGRQLAPITFVFNLKNGTTTIVTGVFPGPSIALDTTSVKLGQDVTVTGTTVPGSAVALTVHSDQTMSLSTVADTLGHWAQIISTKLLAPGTHTATAQAQTGSTLSSQSQTVEFAVSALAKCDGKKTADLNCDASVNLTDFSILLYFWQKTHPTNTRADINGDGIVTIIDFSIMLYQWTS